MLLPKPLSFAVAGLAPVLVGIHAAAAAAAPATFDTSVKPFLEAHCLDCHDADNHKAGLRLDTLPANFHDPKTSATWAHVFDKIVTGEMPPKKKPRPPQAALENTARFLGTQLHTSSLEQQQKKGRVAIRRLNATEYENTLRDLVGTNVALRSLLPEDNTTAGFDNVSSGLDLSSTHLLCYQEAAAKAIASAIPINPPIPFTDERTGLEMTKKGPNFQQGLNKNSKLVGDALVIYSKLPRYGLCCSAPVPSTGRYRIKMSACAVGAAQKPVPVGFMTVENGREDPILREVRDIPAGKPQVIEFEFDLARKQAFVVNLLTLWDIRGFKKPIEEYDGPGVMVEWLKVEGPIDAYPPASYTMLFGDIPLKARSVALAEATGKRPPNIPANRREDQWFADPLVPVSEHPKEDAEKLIRAFLPKAFRRPVSEEVQKHFVGRTQAKLDQGASFNDAMTYGYKLILSSPDFLFLSDAPAVIASTQGDLPSTRLDDYSLAERLSYFLWSTMPDGELLALAAKGELSKPVVLHAQVERMLNSPKGRAFTKNFAGQWLDLRKIDFTIPDPLLYSDFDRLLLWAMPQETELFFEEVVRRDLSLLSFVNSSWTMLNDRLAELYGIPGIEGSQFRKVMLPPGSHRGGVMTQASICKVTADGTRTSPVLRGKWILERILGQPPSPPPPDVPAIEPDIRGATTIREQLDRHRNTPACATCHVHIDPPGFALENYDPIGNWRTFYRVTNRTKAGPVNLPRNVNRPAYQGPDVEQGGQTPDGQPFKDIEDYKNYLMRNPDQIARNLTQKLMVYATGADIQFADREIVEQIVARERARNYGFRSLIHEIVASRVFLNK